MMGEEEDDEEEEDIVAQSERGRQMKVHSSSDSAIKIDAAADAGRSGITS